MTTTSTTAQPVSTTSRRVGIVVTALVALFCLADAIGKLVLPGPVAEAMDALGYPAGTAPVIGGLMLVCTVLYVVPRTTVLGAVLLTGYLGGALAAQLRIEAPLFSTLLFPVYLGVLAWVGAWLRDGRVRALTADLVGRRQPV